MLKAIGSRKYVTDTNCSITLEFFSYIQDLLDVEDVQNLKQYYQHLNTSRFQHSLNVSYYSFLIAKKFKLDTKSIARAGLLHDLFLYDWKNKEQPMEGRHSFVHPRVALETAKKHIDVNPVMEDAIVHHMWPMTLETPKTKEGWIVQGVDKYCAILEMGTQAIKCLHPTRIAFSFLSMISLFIQ